MFMGFSLASYLVNDSFANWSESPFKTTIETRPISELTFPKVTVCPPKNTFTDINYDLMMLENITLTVEQKNELLEITLNELHDQYYQDVIMKNISEIDEENMFFNWYHGYTELKLPYWANGLIYYIQTAATTGKIGTKYFGEKYNPGIRNAAKASFEIRIYTPEYAIYNTSFTLTLEIEKVSGLGKQTIYVSEYGFLDSEDQLVVINFTAPVFKYSIRYQRDYSNEKENIDTESHKKMPGFLLKWRYNLKLDAEAKYTDERFYHENYEFRRFVT